MARTKTSSGRTDPKNECLTPKAAQTRARMGSHECLQPTHKKQSSPKRYDELGQEFDTAEENLAIQIPVSTRPAQK